MWNPISLAAFCWLKASHRSCLHSRVEDDTGAWTPEGENWGGGEWHVRACLPQWPCTVLAKITLMCECIQSHKLKHKEKAESSLCIYAIREEGFCKLIHCIYSYLSASNSQIIPALEPELECSSPMLTAALPMNLHCIQTQLLFWGHSLRDVEKLFPGAWMMVFRRVHV